MTQWQEEIRSLREWYDTHCSICELPFEECEQVSYEEHERLADETWVLVPGI
jgi:hypothetical protein